MTGATADAQRVHRSVPPRLSSSGCAVIDLVLHTTDSLTVTVPAPACGDVRVVVTGPVRSVPVASGVPSMFHRSVDVPIALDNAAIGSLPTPLDVTVDSISPVRGGQQQNAAFSRPFVDVEVWDGRRMQQPWRFVGTTDTSIGAGRPSISPGERTETRVMHLVVDPLTHTLRLWLNVRGAHRRPRVAAPEPAAVRTDTTPIPVDRLAKELTATAHFPKVQSLQGLYRDSTHGVLIFGVSYGEPHDCPSGCFYSQAIGISYRGRAGWLEVHDSVRGARFIPDSRDRYLFSTSFVDGLTGWLVKRALLPVLLRSPNAPRAFLRPYVDGLYAEDDQQLARLLVSSPVVRRDAGLLTELALLPDGGSPYIGARISARAALRALAPTLVHSTTTSPWTLFVVAQTLSRREDSTLALALARHPNARRNPAILTVLAEWHPALRPRAVAAVRATARVRALLAARFAATSATTNRVQERELLADPEIRGSEDALLVLANMTLMRDDQDLVFGASHLLPEGAYRRWEWPIAPVQLGPARAQ